MKKRDDAWHQAVHKVLKRRPLNYERLRELAPLHNGYYQLQSFVSPDRLLRLVAENLDLSQSIFQPINGFGFVTMNHCRFDNMKYLGNIGGHFTDCSFKETRFSGASFLLDTSFTRCDFTGAKFPNFDGRNGIFDTCIFDSCSFKNSYMVDCVFKNCSFRNALFGASTFGGSDFTDMQSSMSWIIDPPGQRVIVRFPKTDHIADFNDTLIGNNEFRANGKLLKIEKA